MTYDQSNRPDSIIVLLMIAGSALSVAKSHASPPPAPEGYRWVPNERYTDEFNGDTLDSTKWNDHHPTWKGRPPAKFMPDTVTVKDGLVRIRNRPLKDRDGRFTIAGGAVVSKDTTAHFGYYEIRMKASKISMSSTFWFSNSFDRSGPSGFAQELDVQEAVGGGKRQPDRKNYMKSNTHFWVIEKGKRRSLAVRGDAPISPAAGEAFHVYGVWWVDATTIKFYHNDDYKFTLKPDTTYSHTPFNRPMQMNMVTETYDWETPPTQEELGDDSINTTSYDWVRSYVLVPLRNEDTD